MTTIQLLKPSEVRTVAGGSGVEGRRGVMYQTVDETPGRLLWWDGEKHVESLSDTESRAVRALLDDRSGRAIGYELEQPADIAAPVRSFGKLACRFGSGMWLTAAGSAVLTQGHTGWDGAGAKNGITSRTGMPDMLKYVPSANTSEGIRLQSVGTNLYNPATAGKLMLAVYIEALPGYQVGGTVAGSIDVTISTSAANDTNGLFVSFNTNQLREGWNFLKFVMRDPLAYAQSSSAVEYHPAGVSVTSYATGADTNIVSNPIQRLRIDTRNLLGATLYFDSIWTDFSSVGQVVLGCDGGINLLEIADPIFDAYDWAGYIAAPFNVVDSGTSNCTVQTSPASNFVAQAAALYAKGWDVINHSATHPSLGGMSSEAAITYQIEAAKAYWVEQGLIRGMEFYASPQSSSSRLSEKVVKAAGIKLQRHARKWNTSVTPWGVDNPHFLGGIDMGSTTVGGIQSITGGAAASIAGWQIYSKLVRMLDVAEAYGDTVFPFWHGLTTSGDSGSGEDLTGDPLLVTASAFRLFCADIRARELAGRLVVCKGMTGFWYGSNA